MGKDGIYSNPASLLSLVSLSRDSHSQVPFRVRLRQSAEQSRHATLKPFDDQISKLRGSVDGDGIERISSQQLAAVLSLQAKERTPARWRMIAAAMARHGWTAVRFRGVGPSGHREQLRGFVRLARD